MIYLVGINLTNRLGWSASIYVCATKCFSHLESTVALWSFFIGRIRKGLWLFINKLVLWIWHLYKIFGCKYKLKIWKILFCTSPSCHLSCAIFSHMHLELELNQWSAFILPIHHVQCRWIYNITHSIKNTLAQAPDLVAFTLSSMYCFSVEIPKNFWTRVMLNVIQVHNEKIYGILCS